MPAETRGEHDRAALEAPEHVRAPAKLTRSLRVVGRRDDGYHLLESEMLSLELADELEISDLGLPAVLADDPQACAAAGSGSLLELVDQVRWSAPAGQAAGTIPTPPIPTGDDNLVLRALRLAGRTARVRLCKRIPAGAGLGGGSSDAAAVLRWAGVSSTELALRLGADVPFCVAGGRAMVRGVGEVVEPLAFDDAAFLLCTPPGGVSTVEAYRAFDELGPGEPDPERRNDLELAALSVWPGLVLWRDLLAEVTGHRPQLAGSGSTWFVELPAGAAGGASRAGEGGGRTAPRADLVAELGAAVSAAGARASVALARSEAAPGTGG